MKKIIILICFIFLTACKADYNLVFENNQIKESLNVISLSNDESFRNSIDEYYSNSILLVDYNIDTGDMSNNEIISKYSIYDKSIINNEDKYGLNLGYKYKVNSDYKDSSIINSLFDTFTFSDTYLRAYDIKNIFSYYSNLDEINISVKIDKIVETSNADKIENGIYYWNINKDNWKNKTIMLTYSNSESDHIKNIIESSSSNILYIIFGILGVCVLISIVVIYDKVKNSNK